jgi:hypothetical protein
MQTFAILSDQQKATLHRALVGRKIVLCFGAGVDSTAMIVALRAADLVPDLITMADTGGEKDATWTHVLRMNALLASWGWPSVTVVKKKTLPSTPYDDLYGNCFENETLPSLAFGMKSCSIKWKQDPQDQFLMGVKVGANKHVPHPLWIDAKRQKTRILKLIGYDCGRADKRRSAKPVPGSAPFDYCYPLQLIGWNRADCVAAIERSIGPDMVPIKSACFFCPASKEWELYWLAANHPDMLERALRMEYRALTGRHSRFDALEFGATWEDMMRNHDRFPSTATCVGLGRSFSWNQWARVNQVVDENFRVLRDAFSRARFLLQSEALQQIDNAQDSRQKAKRQASGRKVFPIHLEAA